MYTTKKEKTDNSVEAGAINPCTTTNRRVEAEARKTTLLELWSELHGNGGFYATCLERFLTLVQEAKRLKIEGLHVRSINKIIKKCDQARAFLSITSEESAQEFIASLKQDSVIDLVDTLEEIREDGGYFSVLENTRRELQYSVNVSQEGHKRHGNKKQYKWTLPCSDGSHSHGWSTIPNT